MQFILKFGINPLSDALQINILFFFVNNFEDAPYFAAPQIGIVKIAQHLHHLDDPLIKLNIMHEYSGKHSILHIFNSLLLAGFDSLDELVSLGIYDVGVLLN